MAKTIPRQYHSPSSDRKEGLLLKLYFPVVIIGIIIIIIIITIIIITIIIVLLQQLYTLTLMLVPLFPILLALFIMVSSCSDAETGGLV